MCRLARAVAAPVHTVWKKSAGQTVDFLPRWIRQHGCLKEGLAHMRYVAQTLRTLHVAPGTDSGFLGGWGFICVGEGVHFADFISFFLNIPLKMK